MTQNPMALIFIIASLFLAGCGAMDNELRFPHDPVYPRIWKVQSVSSIPNIPEDQLYELRFMEGLEMTLDCNEGAGEYNFGDILSLDFKILTVSDCGSGSLYSEIFTLLESVQGYEVDYSQMTLHTAAEKSITLVLIPNQN